MRVASLGSGSKGNGTLIDDGTTCLLVDLGFTLKETIARFKRLEIDPTRVDAVLVTHEHADHIHGVAAFARKFATPVYLTAGTYQQKQMGALPSLVKINPHLVFDIGSMKVEPVPVPHDAREPCQYLIHSGPTTLGILTDVGHITPHVELRYQECDALLLECNHDMEMLTAGPYPYPLKQRVGGDYGHLNNGQAAALLTKINLTRLNHLVITHISQKNNHPDIARRIIEETLVGWQGNLVLADQDLGFDWFQV